ncbi:tetratricopeptide repeat protein [Chryseobacterium lactis]|nr:tetratricopeptide repeat protein [Chryseobacterium lactis]
MYYAKINKWDLYVKSFVKSVNIFKKNPHENFVLAVLYIGKVKNTSMNRLETVNLSDCILANKFALLSGNSLLISATYYDIGTFYNTFAPKQKHVDSTIAAYNKGFEVSLKIKDIEVRKKVQFYYYNNVGITYANNKEYSKTLQIFNKGLQTYDYKDKFYIWSLLTNIGYLYVLMQDNDTALKYYQKAEIVSTDKQVTDQNRIGLYLNISKLYEKMHLFDKALVYDKKARETIIKEDKRLYENNTRSLDTFYQTEQEKNILEEKNKSYKKYEIWYISAIISIVLGLILLFFTLDYRQKLNKKTTSLLESEKQKLKMENELFIMKQEQLQRQALATSIQLEHKNTFINELKVNLPKDKKFNHLLKDEQLMDNNFNTIRDIIQETHPNFFKRLNELAKNRLTNLDLKYVAYIYLNMDNIQIATALKVDPKTVSVTKYRLKQKLGVRKGQDLNTFIRTMNY